MWRGVVIGSQDRLKICWMQIRMGSSPILAILGACNSVDRVLPLQGRSRRFESCQVHIDFVSIFNES